MEHGSKFSALCAVLPHLYSGAWSVMAPLFKGFTR